MGCFENNFLFVIIVYKASAVARVLKMSYILLFFLSLVYMAVLLLVLFFLHMSSRTTGLR
jgi:hypothetical protein